MRQGLCFTLCTTLTSVRNGHKYQRGTAFYRPLSVLYYINRLRNTLYTPITGYVYIFRAWVTGRYTPSCCSPLTHRFFSTEDNHNESLILGTFLVLSFPTVSGSVTVHLSINYHNGTRGLCLTTLQRGLRFTDPYVHKTR